MLSGSTDASDVVVISDLAKVRHACRDPCAGLVIF